MFDCSVVPEFVAFVVVVLVSALVAYVSWRFFLKDIVKKIDDRPLTRLVALNILWPWTVYLIKIGLCGSYLWS